MLDCPRPETGIAVGQNTSSQSRDVTNDGFTSPFLVCVRCCVLQSDATLFHLVLQGTVVEELVVASDASNFSSSSVDSFICKVYQMLSC